jgi:hypothetical protein
MEPKNSGGGSPKSGVWERSDEFRLVLALARALRQEFGVEIDAHPGGAGNEAGVVNRAFRAAVNVILGSALAGDDPAAMRTWVLRRTALRRLHEVGISGQQAGALLDMESALGDCWFTYLALAPRSVIDDLMRGEAGG